MEGNETGRADFHKPQPVVNIAAVFIGVKFTLYLKTHNLVINMIYFDHKFKLTLFLFFPTGSR